MNHTPTVKIPCYCIHYHTCEFNLSGCFPQVLLNVKLSSRYMYVWRIQGWMKIDELYLCLLIFCCSCRFKIGTSEMLQKLVCIKDNGPIKIRTLKKTWSRTDKYQCQMCMHFTSSDQDQLDEAIWVNSDLNHCKVVQLYYWDVMNHTPTVKMPCYFIHSLPHLWV